MTKSVPAGTTPGTFLVYATASDVNHSPVTSSASCSVTTPPPAINMTLTAAPSSVKVRSNVTIQSVVTRETDGAPVAGATVTFTLTRPKGTTTYTATTNASGVATWVYKAQQKGAHSVMATGNASGMTDSAGPAAFTAN
jgi:hypothetical protein